MLKASVNNKTFDIQQNATETLLNGAPFDWDFAKTQDGNFSILYNNRSFNAEVIEADYASKSFVLKINNSVYTVGVKDRFDILLDQLGMSNAASSKVNDLKAPMPGLVVDIKVSVGDSVQKGDTLLILEAMKMENVLKATGDGKVKSIKVAARENVEKNQVMIEFE
ncbi:acetyl-CoA carboxylase biotin carboxyl carrier protein subunit [Flectobacillus longus]|jgi:biotin carboxyl carrier protein|uniref:Acetyl-CoA carboxylase biotin carboxyl carrier protein subunit n=1 Tax=Flectobacillus longus TaxID=2984207 RepID=A0ABT6YUZ3_9BACT|nr:acetyl-CoA carboxylase biotin carboxyl carrier protein subunit [Flectobacillus longus]MDI9866923.1 acetyl-CoA carboxylase biotin carboxyl carrier protein subunit [Flectobacillus longus]MDI9878508.1 acetyl-CoA carboxylase biotin carboxyl carrier protein subunit [Flectobacillus longus]